MSAAHDTRFNSSGVELLAESAANCSPSGCLLISRNIDNIDESKPNIDKYLDMHNGKVNGTKQERQNKFRQSLLSRLGDENKHHFNLKWSAQFQDIYQILPKENSPNETANGGASFNSFNKFDPEFKHYLESLNAIVVSNVKALVERRIQEDNGISTRLNESTLYQEVTRHLCRYQQLADLSLIDSNDYVEHLKKLINIGAKNDHHPIFLYGASICGKSTTLARFGSIAYSLLDPKTCLNIVRFADLTSQCSTFEGLLYSICDQLCVLQKANPSHDIKNKDLAQLIEYFHKSCEYLARTKGQLLILVDGLQDINVERSLITKSNIGNNQISWLFFKLLPPGVHLIVAIKKQTNSVKIENEMIIKKNASMSSMSTNMTEKSASAVPLFLHYFNEKMSSEAENYLFELPLQIKKSDIGFFVTFIKNELERSQRQVSEKQLQMVVQSLSNQKGFDSNSNINASSQSSASCPNLDTQSCFLYLSFLIKEILLANDLNCDLNAIFNEDKFPKDLDSLLKFKIGNIWRFFFKFYFFLF